MASLDTDLGQHPNRMWFWITSEAWDTPMFGLTTEKTRHTTLSQVILAYGSVVVAKLTQTIRNYFVLTHGAAIT
jgi:hypothetical protein